MRSNAHESSLSGLQPGMEPRGVAGVLAAARASLKEPSRPYTPAENRGRSMFDGNDYRPVSRAGSAGAPLHEHGKGEGVGAGVHFHFLFIKNETWLGERHS